jgi:hypothetical protein
MISTFSIIFRMLPSFVKLLALSVSGAFALPQAPAGTSTDPFAPNGAVGGILQKVGNVTLGPAPKGCSKYELVVGQSHLIISIGQTF